MEWWLIYLLLGAIVGYIAGLFGIGGGLVIVPALVYMFTLQAFPADRVLHFALGTTMATIIFTSLSSLRMHHVHGAVNWLIVRYLSPGIILGTLAGSTLASALSTSVLGVIVVLFIYYAATQMWLKLLPKPEYTLPGKGGLFITGSIIGSVSSLVAIGGGLLTVPFLSLCKVKLQQAIGTAAAVGFPISLAGTIGYIVNGELQTQALPEYSLGYVYLPALGWIAAASMLTAPLGAKTTHRIQTATLKKLFIVLLYCLGTKMLFDILSN
ncbi:MAG: sulfite exporter TauE/SafE family protein [Nitrosomonas sp.]|nr:sulfite exporter TauE/SafE family protein [Nitrosomonas sp.]